MTDSTILIYGAYGFTGRLITEEAVARGHRPIVAGRRPERVAALARELELDHRAFGLEEVEEVVRGLEGVAAVVHAAGPFVHTAPVMVEACLRAGVHYLDITGEVAVFEHIFERGREATERGVALMPGVGLDVVPTDAVAAALAELVVGGRRLDLALSPGGPASAGTLRTVLEHLSAGLRVRRDGELRPSSPARREFRRSVDFGPGAHGGVRSVAPYTWGDLATAWRTTGIPDITCYMATPPRVARALPWALPWLRILLAVKPVRKLAQGWVGRTVQGPDDETQRTARGRVWGRIETTEGEAAEAVLELPESYRFTAIAAVRAVEEVLRRNAPGSPGLAGALTPAGAFGHRWVTALPGVEWIREPERVSAPDPSN